MLQESTIERVAGVFFTEPTRKHYLKGIARQCGIAHTSVRNALSKLIAEEIIAVEEEERGTRTYPLYYANSTNERYIHYKILHNLEKLYRSGLISHLQEQLQPRTIILFGSYQRGEDDEQSDIDLMIEAPNQQIDTAPYEIALSRPIQLHFRKSFKEIPDELKNNLINGIVMAGFLEGY